MQNVFAVNSKREILAAFFLCLATTLVAYFPYRDMAFIFDDLPTLRISLASLGNDPSSAFVPMTNGFWRPLHRLLIMATASLFGLWPLAFHSLGLALHVTNGVLLFILARHAVDLDFRRALGACFLFQVSAAGALAVIQPGNFADLLALTAILAALISHSLVGGPLGSGLFIASVVMGFLSKEIFVVFPVLLAAAQLSGWRQRGAYHFKWRVALCLSLSCLYLLLLSFSIAGHHSYVSDGRLDVNPVHVVRRFCDYVLSLGFPYLHVFESPVLSIHLPHSLLWLLRLMVLLALAWCLYRLARRPADGRRYMMVALVVTPLVMPSLIAMGTESRYLYIPSCFFALFVATFLASSTQGGLRWLVLYGLAIFLPGIWLSPTLKNLRGVAENVSAIVAQLHDQQMEIPAGASIAILNHPHVSPESYNWVYRQLIFDVHFPERGWRYISEGMAGDADLVFRFDEADSSLIMVGDDRPFSAEPPPPPHPPLTAPPLG